MDAEIARAIADYGNLDVYEDYSGRGMFGKTTTGIIFADTQELVYTLSEQGKR